MLPVQAGGDEPDHSAIYGLFSTTRLSDFASVAMGEGAFRRAEIAYQILVSKDPQNEDYLSGLFNASSGAGDWESAKRALDELVKLHPHYKKSLDHEYGVCLYKLGKQDEAERFLKRALRKSNKPSVLVDRISLPSGGSELESAGVECDPRLSTAFNHCEVVLIAEYRTFEGDSDKVSYRSPPAAIFKPLEYLNGHLSTSESVPVRFDFHQYDLSEEAHHWRFEPDKMMPESGSKWILFVTSALPIDGALTTYCGSLGRVPLNEESYVKIVEMQSLFREGKLPDHLCGGGDRPNKLTVSDVGAYGSITVSKRAHEASILLKKGDFERALAEYRILIGLSPKTEDFYFGFYESAFRAGDWQQAKLALDELLRLHPEYQDRLDFEYGACLYHQRQYEEAERLLRRALDSNADSPLSLSKLKELESRSIIKGLKKWKPPSDLIRKVDADHGGCVFPPPPPPSLEDACRNSETVIVASYWGFDGESTTYYNPPGATFERLKFLKGRLPRAILVDIRYEFRTHSTGPEKPRGWKFEPEKMMPAPGSKWILFLSSSTPIDGLLGTYQGAYGRMRFSPELLLEVEQMIEKQKK
ncbi:MAG: tetratricopeptide repeat protein [Candidatus Obscuribacterales bacterium]